MTTTPLSQWPVGNFLASGDRMKVLNINENGISFVLNGWGFQFLLFTAQKPFGDSQSFSSFPVISVVFQWGWNFWVSISPGTIFWPIFPVGHFNLLLDYEPFCCKIQNAQVGTFDLTALATMGQRDWYQYNYWWNHQLHWKEGRSRLNAIVEQVCWAPNSLNQSELKNKVQRSFELHFLYFFHPFGWINFSFECVVRNEFSKFQFNPTIFIVGQSQSFTVISFWQKTLFQNPL